MGLFVMSAIALAIDNPAAWRIERQSNLCIGRQPSAPPTATQFAFKYQPSAAVTELLILAGGSNDAQVPPSGHVKLSLEPNGPSTESDAIAFAAGSVIRLPLDIAEGLDSYQTLRLQPDKRGAGTLNIPAIDVAAQMLRACGGQVMKDLGINSATLRSLNSFPPGVMSEAAQNFGRDAYPKEAQKNREQGRVVLLLKISAIGRVDSCRIIASSGSKGLDEGTCELATAKFRLPPSKDARWVAGYSLILPVNWRLS